MNIQAYLYFNGRCAEAVEFYRRALGAQVEMMMRVGDSPEPPRPGALPPGSENNVMHAALKVGDSYLLASDGMAAGPAQFAGFNLSLQMPDASAANRVFAALGDGGTVQMPLGKTFWSPLFGIVRDRFGVAWMINQVA
jgi:PhnB protein